MPAPFFTNNESEITRVEGLYIMEKTPPAQIQGAFLGIVGITGETVRGPVDVPVSITSETDFKAIFGGRDYGSGGAIVNKVWQAMLNKPFGEVLIVRAAAAAAVAANSNLADVVPTEIIAVTATSPGAWGNNVTFQVTNATDADANHFNLLITYLGTVYTYENLDVHATGVDNTLSVIGDALSNVVKVTKLADGRPLNIGPSTLGAAGHSFTAGSNGSIADSDFTASGRGINQLTHIQGPAVVFIAERSSSSLKSALLTAAQAASDRIFLMGADDDTIAKSAAITDAAMYQSDRVVYCYNHPYTLDPETATSIVTAPDAWMASILSQIDVDINPGEESTKKYTAGIQKLTTENYARDDYADFNAAGIAAFEKDDGFAFVSAVTTSQVPGLKQITRRRSADFIQLSVASELKHQVKKKNTQTWRDGNLGIISGFLAQLADAERVVDKKDDGSPAFQLVDKQKNTSSPRIVMRVKLIDHALQIVLETEIGENVTFTQTQ